MTEYDAFAIYREQEEKDKISAIEANNGLITYILKMKQQRFGKEIS